MNTYWHERSARTLKSDRERVAENLAYVAANPTARYPAGWRESTQADARSLGLLPQLAPVVGCNCKPGIDRGIVYGGDMADVF